MFKNVALGVYHPGASVLHRLQARTKLLALIGLVIAIIIANHREWHFAPYIAIVGLVVAGMVSARISPREMWRRMWILVVLLLLSALPLLAITEIDARKLYAIGPLLLSYGLAKTLLLICLTPLTLILLLPWLPQRYTAWEPRWLKRLWWWVALLVPLLLWLYWLVSRHPAMQPLAIGPYVITYGGAWLLVTGSAVLLVFFALSILVTTTTSPVMLIEGVTMLLAPLRRLKMPVDDFALMSLIALRFVPTLLEEVEQLMKAQTARGADVANGTLSERVQSATTIFVPLIQGILRRASELATALEARGYQVEGRQTFLHETHFGLLDYLVMAVVVLVMVGSLLL